MTNLILVFIFLFWTIFGSFASVLIFRIKSGEKWIINWRSHCKDCNYILWPLDLFPIFSWIFLGWKCRKCKSKIWAIYPILELSMWLAFFYVAKFIVNLDTILLGNTWELLKLLIYIVLIFLTVVFIFYDIKYQEVPDSIMLPWILIWFSVLIWDTFFWLNIFNHIIPFFNSPEINNHLINWLFWVLFLYSFFYLQIFISALISAKNDKQPILKVAKELIVIYFTFIFLIIKWAFNKEETEDDNEWSPTTWIWFWDLSIAIFMWLILWFKLILIATFVTYILWSIIWVIVMSINKQKIIPFWPFLWVSLWICVVFWEKLINLYLWLLM